MIAASAESEKHVLTHTFVVRLLTENVSARECWKMVWDEFIGPARAYNCPLSLAQLLLRLWKPENNPYNSPKSFLVGLDTAL